MKLLTRLLFSAAVLLVATGVQAVPSTFFFTSGSVTITASTELSNQLVMSTTVPMDGVFVTFDQAGDGELTDFLFSMPQTPVLTLTGYGPYDELVIESSTIQPGIGYNNLFNTDQGGGIYTFLAGPTDIDGIYSVSDSGGILPPQNNVPINLTDDSLINGTVDLNSLSLELLGITLLSIEGAPFGESENLIVKGDFTLIGAVPEPGTAALLSLGMVSLGIRSRQARLG